MAKPRKSFPLRISHDLYDDLRGWADHEMRSLNAQIEFILRDAVRRRKKGSHSAGQKNLTQSMRAGKPADP
jgi:hypothetical protein